MNYKSISAIFLFAVVLMSCAMSTTKNGVKSRKSFTFQKGVSLNHWTSQPIDSFTYADPRWFNKSDVEWIAKTGIDHIQLYIMGTEIMTIDEKIMADKIRPIDSLIHWCAEVGLGVILSPARMPSLPVDSTVTREERVEKNLRKYAVAFGVFADYFKNHGENLRFLLNIGTEDKSIRNRYYQQIIPEIRKTNRNRKLYITAYSINRLNELEILEDDKNIILAIEISQSTAAKAEAVDVFAWQHQDYFFTDKMPLVAFPGTIPSLDTTMVTDLGKWALPFSNTKLEENYFDKQFDKGSRWMNQNNPKGQLYVSHFRYWTGYPFDPQTVKDKKSFNHFMRSFAKAVKKHKIDFCIYDYNSGSGIRYPNGEKALILEALDLNE
jgi:hypothetical protein